MDHNKNTTGQHWWVVQTKPQGEALAIEHLHEQKLTTYCPMYQKETIRGRQMKVTTTALFARYVFVLADQAAQQSVHTIRSTRGVSQLIKVGEQPTLVKASIIEVIKALETEHLNQTKHYFKENDEVLITSGLYQGMEAIYQMEDGLERAVVMLNLLQRDTQLTLDKTQLRKSSSSAL
ncbi:transcription termination/antitermination NusG family protein [Methylophilaceae bacterium Uisw_097]